MNILIVDDHPVLREGLATLLELGLQDSQIDQVGSVAAAVAIIAERSDLDLVILDYLLPAVGGRAAVAEIGGARADLPIIVYSSSENPEDVRQALAAGALGYVRKSASPNVLLSAIRTVLAGEVYVPPVVVHSPQPARGLLNAVPDVEGLTARQVDVLALLSQGFSNKTIATTLDLSEKTVKAHITAIFKALNVVNRTQAAGVARSIGLI